MRSALALADLFSEAEAMAAADPVAAMSWSAWQRDVLTDLHRFLVVRAANQIGKTMLAAAIIIMEIRGTNPFRPPRHRGPLNILLCSESYEQMSREGGVLEKLWEMLPKDEIDPKVSFIRGKGLMGVKYPAIRFISGPGAGSVIRLFRYEQGARKLAGSTLHGIVLDEPCPSNVYSEAVPRLNRNKGWLLATFTPTPDMPDQTFMQELIKAGRVSEHHVELTPEACWPEGNARPFMSPEDIADFIASLPAHDVPLRVKASWDTSIEGRVLTAWHEGLVEAFDLAQLPEGVQVVVGIDHGLDAGKQRVVLLLVADGESDAPSFWLFDEVALEEATTTEEDADNVLAMLEKHGMGYDHVDIWVGDRSAQDKRNIKFKDNNALLRAILRRVGRQVGDKNVKKIVVPAKYQSSVSQGVAYMNRAMKAGRWKVHPRCAAFIGAARQWKGGRREPEKDIVDAARYAMQQAVGGNIMIQIKASY